MSATSSDSPGSQPHPKGRYRALPGSIWVLGLGSMFMDTSSELVHSLLPAFMASVLGASVVSIGVIEGIAEATAASTKVFSGALSDYFRNRKVLIVFGYGLSAITKPLFPLATTLSWVFAARFVDRVGKGIRGAPRDALIADIVLPASRGTAYGLRQALDSVGAFLGPLAALGFMALFANDITEVLWVAVVPAFLAVLLLIVAVREPEPTQQKTGPRTCFTLAGATRLPLRYWLVVALGAVFTLARFSEAFLILRARDVGLPLGSVPVVMVIMNVAYAMVAYPAGTAADRLSARTLLLVGLGMLIAADVALALASSPSLVFLGSALWGLCTWLAPKGFLRSLLQILLPLSFVASPSASSIWSVAVLCCWRVCSRVRFGARVGPRPLSLPGSSLQRSQPWVWHCTALRPQPKSPDHRVAQQELMWRHRTCRSLRRSMSSGLVQFTAKVGTMAQLPDRLARVISFILACSSIKVKRHRTRSYSEVHLRRAWSERVETPVLMM